MLGFSHRKQNEEISQPEKFINIFKEAIERFGLEKDEVLISRFTISGSDYEFAVTSDGVKSILSDESPFLARDAVYLTDPGERDLDSVSEKVSRYEVLKELEGLDRRKRNYTVSTFMRIMDLYDMIEKVNGVDFNGRIENPRVISSIVNHDPEVFKPFDLINIADAERHSLVLMTQTLGAIKFRQPTLFVKDSFIAETYCERYLQEDFGDDFGFPINPAYTPFHMCGILWKEFCSDILEKLKNDEVFIVDEFNKIKEEVDGFDFDDDYDPFDVGDFEDLELDDESFSQDALQVDEEEAFTKNLESSIDLNKEMDESTFDLFSENMELEDEVKRQEISLRIEMKKYVDVVSPIMKKKHMNLTSMNEDNEDEEFSNSDSVEAERIYQKISEIEKIRKDLNDRRKVVLSKLSLKNIPESAVRTIDKKIDGIDSVDNMTIYVPTEEELEDERRILEGFLGNETKEDEILNEESDNDDSFDELPDEEDFSDESSDLLESSENLSEVDENSRNLENEDSEIDKNSEEVTKSKKSSSENLLADHIRSLKRVSNVE